MFKKLLLTFLVCIYANPALAFIPDSNTLTFDIFRNDKALGEHRVSFEKENGNTIVNINIDMQYDLGPITLFRYAHQNTEIWKGNKVLSMKSTTNDDGDDYKVDATWAKQSVNVTANENTFEAAPTIFPTSYWNPVFLKSDQLLNTQKGEIEDITVTKAGTKNITIAGETITADHYKVAASIPLDLYYDQKSKQWVGLEFEARGSTIKYRRTTPINGNTQ